MWRIRLNSYSFTKCKIVNNFWLDDFLNLKFSQCFSITKWKVAWNFYQNLSMWRHYDVIGHFCPFYLEYYLEYFLIETKLVRECNFSWKSNLLSFIWGVNQLFLTKIRKVTLIFLLTFKITDFDDVIDEIWWRHHENQKLTYIFLILVRCTT